MGRITGNYMGVGDGDGEGKTRLHPTPLPCLLTGAHLLDTPVDYYISWFDLVLGLIF